MPSLANRISNGFGLFGADGQTSLKSSSDSIVFDSTTSISIDRSASVTNHAIEKGSDVTDHVSSDPITVNFSAIISDADWDPLDPMSFFNKNVKERLDLLKQWMDNKEILKYFYYGESIENVVIESYSEEQSVDLGQGRQLQFKLKKINIVESKTVDAKSPVKKGLTQPAKASISGNAGANKPSCSAVRGG